MKVEEHPHADAVLARRLQERVEVVEIHDSFALLHRVPDDPRPHSVEAVLGHACKVAIPVLPERGRAAKVLRAKDEHGRASSSRSTECRTARGVASCVARDPNS